MRFGGAEISAPLSPDFWRAYAAFLKSERVRHLEDVALIDGRLEAIKPLVPGIEDIPSDIWVEKRDAEDLIAKHGGITDES